MSSLRSPTSPPQASRSEFIKAEISQHLTELAVPQVRYLKIIEKSGYQVSLLTGWFNQFGGKNWRNLISRNICLHFSLSWHTRIWNLRRESFILKCCLDRVFLTVEDTIWYDASVEQTNVYMSLRGKFPRPSRIPWGCIFGPSLGLDCLHLATNR